MFFSPDYSRGYVDIDKIRFYVEPGVFLPREETEWWIDLIKQLKVKQRTLSVKHNLSSLNFRNNFKNRIFSTFLLEIRQKLIGVKTLVDLGAGSGLIGLSLVDYFPQVYLIEKYLIPFKNIQKTISYNKITKVKLVRLFSNSYLKDKLLSLNNNWVLVCNPPYVPLEDYQYREENRIDNEPSSAIFSGLNGLSFFQNLFSFFQRNKRMIPAVAFFELDPRNITRARSYAKTIFNKTLIISDQNNLKRLLICYI